jgi:hypothetical protein
MPAMPRERGAGNQAQAGDFGHGAVRADGERCDARFFGRSSGDARVAFVQDGLQGAVSAWPDQRRPGAGGLAIAHRAGGHGDVGAEPDRLANPGEAGVEQVAEILVAPPGTVRVRIGADQAL